MSYLKLLLITVAFTLFSCGEYKSSSPAEKSKHDLSPPIYGWFDGNCFATLANELSSETKLFVVRLDDPQSVSSATIIGPANIENCGPLSNDRRERNESEGLMFYEVKSDQPFDLAIGLVGEAPPSRIIDNTVLVDLTNDGTFEHFTHCATSDGISFDIWNSTPYEQEPLWSGFYYLGYDVERNCP